MRLALPPELHQHRHEAVAVAIAAISVGMFIGTWVIGPAISYDSAGRAVEQSETLSFQAMLSRPDPFPFRTPTPAFDVSGPPSYAATARERAQTELGGEPSADDPWQSPVDQPRSRSRYRYPVPDRHRPL